MMMMITQSLMTVRRRGFEGEREEEAGDKMKVGRKGTPTSGADVPIGLFRSGVWNASGRRKY